jgi:2,4-dienoyl-CoA reductase-like NADH-dependent reductase (Old Yellow Enzyme family)/thioredoxin reductase
MDPSLADTNGYVTDAMIRHYRDRARGGAGLLITGNVACRRQGRVSPWMPLIESDDHVEGFARVSEAVHAEGGRVFVQVSHAGRQCLSEFTGEQPVSASAIPCPVMREAPRALDDEEVDALADDFAAAAARVQASGADGVEFHMAHGYLVCQFLSPYSNRRTDRWGGSPENRARLALEILRRARARVGPDFPIQCRLSADERVDGGIEPPLALDIATRLVAAGVTSLSISACNYESYRFNMPVYYLPTGTYAHLAAFVRAGLRAAGHDTPIVAVGRFRDGDASEAALIDGQADLVAMGRALIADPDLPRHLEADDEARVRPCLACNRCSEAITRGPLRCLVNPEAGRNPAPAPPASAPRRILVIGGGPGGVTAAIEAAHRGHAVRLVEARDRLGGRARDSAIPPGKEDFDRYADWLADRCAEAGVDVQLGTAITPGALAEEPADAILVAVGAEPRPPPEIGGLEHHPLVLHAPEALADPRPRRHVLIVGGGPEGCEVADAFAARDPAPAVSLVELRPKVGVGLPTSLRAILQSRLETAGVRLWTRRTVAAIEDGGVSLVDRRGRPKETLPPADLVVVATGVQVPVAWQALRDDPRVHLVGDAAQPATILEAVYEGWKLGRSL